MLITFEDYKKKYEAGLITQDVQVALNHIGNFFVSATEKLLESKSSGLSIRGAVHLYL